MKNPALAGSIDSPCLGSPPILGRRTSRLRRSFSDTGRFQFEFGSGLSSLLCIISVGMSDDNATRFRKQAEECREQAAKAVSPLDKEAWLRVAEEWLKLALSVEMRPQG